MEQFALGEVCTIIKGSTGIKKAIAGDYPLVVTAEERLSSNEYQFDTKAVCIPLVSSTGHGHASLKRIHYQEGKFALGNILAAVIPNDEKQLNAEFLYYYLSFYKDSKIVPLMKGAANVSLTINSIKTIIIEIPDIKIQEKIIETIKKAKCKSNLINNKCSEQELLIESLKKSILFDAVQGKLVPQDPSDEPVSELLKRIQAEKEQLFKDSKIKKEKSLPPITEVEIPFQIPTSWQWVKLGDIVNYGSTGSVEYSDSLDKNTWILDLEDIEKGTSKLLVKTRIQKKAFNSTKKCFQKGDVLYGKLRPYLDKVLVADEDGICTTEILPLRAYADSNPFYLRLVLKNPTFLQYVNQLTYGVKMPRLGTDDGRNALIPLPPIAEQRRIVNKVNKLMEFIETIEKNNNLAKKNISILLKSIEDRTLAEYSCKNNNIISDIKEKRAILSAEIISQLHNEQYFGAIKLEKILYLCETHLKISLGGKYKQEAAGPHDAQSRYEVEDILKNKKWFSVHKEQKSNIEVTKYTPLEKSNEIFEIFNKVFSAEATEINNLLELFRGKNSDFCESVATLYAVWINRLRKNLSCTDADLISDFKAWSDKKSRFYDSDLQDRILFMRRKNLIPDSNIK